jgi:hypothetical protein
MVDDRRRAANRCSARCYEPRLRPRGSREPRLDPYRAQADARGPAPDGTDGTDSDDSDDSDAATTAATVSDRNAPDTDTTRARRPTLAPRRIQRGMSCARGSSRLRARSALTALFWWPRDRAAARLCDARWTWICSSPTTSTHALWFAAGRRFVVAAHGHRLDRGVSSRLGLSAAAAPLLVGRAPRGRRLTRALISLHNQQPGLLRLRLVAARTLLWACSPARAPSGATEHVSAGTALTRRW